MKLLICVIANNTPEYNKLYKGVKDTWGSIKIDNIKILYIYGTPNIDPYIVDDKLYIDVEDTFQNIGYKTLKMFDYINKNYSYDYIFRTNLSSYIVQDKLLEYLDDKPVDKFFNAVIGYHPNGIKFASGAGYIISKDIVETILEIKNLWDHNFMDDVALGKLILENTDIQLTSANRIDYDDVSQVREYNDPKIYHFRCKTHKIDRNNDVAIFKRLHSIYYDSSNNRRIEL